MSPALSSLSSISSTFAFGQRIPASGDNTAGEQDCMPIYWTNADGTAIQGGGSKFWDDANASNLKVAVPYNGTNGGTTFSDVHADVPGASGSNHTLTVVGDSQTSTATSK